MVFLKGNKLVAGNSPTRLLLGFSGCLEQGLGFLHSVPHMRSPSLHPCWTLIVLILVEVMAAPSSCIQVLNRGLPQGNACEMKGMESRFWGVSAFMQQVQRAEVMCLRSQLISNRARIRIQNLVENRRARLDPESGVA